jgi:nitroimidazol reductase NimA-like FMN-containing flavoprotein (pyridoxamine 5'-phosphate oxidase superfamily)
VEPISDAKAREFLDESLVAHIGVIIEGEPYVTPMSFVLNGNRILLRTKPGQRLSGMTANPVVSVEASDFDEETGDWTSVIAKGTASVADDDETVQTALAGLFEKYRKVLGSPLSRGGMQPISSFPHVIAIEIAEISGMCSSGPFSMRTRPGRL